MAREDRIDFVIGLKNQTQKGIASIKKSLGGLDAAFAGIGTGLSVAGIAAFTTQAAKAADDINKLSDRLGVSTEALSEFQFVAGQSGVEFQTFATGLQRAVRRISEAAEGTGPAADALIELGLNARQLQTLEPDQAFEVLAEALSRVDDEYRRVALAQKIFDSEGVRLLQITKDGAAGVRALREEFRAMGGTLDGATAQIGSDLVDAFGRFKASTVSLSNDLLRVFGPALADITNFLAGALPKAIKFTSRSFEGLRFALAKTAQGAAELLGLDEAARSLSNVAAEAHANVLDLSGEVSRLGASAGEASNAADFLDDSLGRMGQTAKQAAAASKAFTEQLRRQKEAEADLASAIAEEDRILQGRERALLEVATPVERMQIAIRNIKQEQREFGLSSELTARRVTQAYIDIIDAAKDTGAKANDETAKALKQLKTEVEGFSRDLVNTFFDASKSIADIFEDLAVQIAQIFFKKAVADPLVEGLQNAIGGLLKGGAGGGALGGIGSKIGSFFSGFFADGGTIRPGTFGVVGERGPEIVTGGTSGANVTPIGGGSVNITFNVNSLDPRNAAGVIVENRDTIVAVVQGAFNRAGNAARMA